MISPANCAAESTPSLYLVSEKVAHGHHFKITSGKFSTEGAVPKSSGEGVKMGEFALTSLPRKGNLAGSI